jgi:hypothetical protein
MMAERADSVNVEEIGLVDNSKVAKQPESEELNRRAARE